VLCLILSPFALLKKKKEATSLRNVLVMQFWGIGETILTLPAIKALRQRFPKANITVLATPRNKAVYESFNTYSRLKIINLNPFSIAMFILKNRNKFDLVVDMEEYLNISSIIALFVGTKRVGYSHGIRSLLYTDKVVYDDSQHVTETFSELVRKVGAKHSVSKLEKLIINTNDKKVVENLLNKLGISKRDKIIGIVPGAAESAKSRMWPEHNFAKLADKLAEKYKAKIIFVGGGYERNLIANIQDLMKQKSWNLAGRITLKQAFYLIELCKLFISNDTGPMHIAAAQGVKTIGLFGPNLPIRFGPFGKNNIPIYRGKVCKYSPCINVHKGQIPDCLYSRMSSDYQKCMKAIKISDVLRAATKLL
jgi:heptosyltransferase-2